MGVIQGLQKWVTQGDSCRNMNILYFSLLSLVFLCSAVFFPQSKMVDWIEQFGTLIQIALPVYALVPLISQKDKVGAIQMLKYLLLCLIITYLCKFFIPEKRPYGGSMSFPSGHTVGAFIGVCFLGFRYGLWYLLVALPFGCFVAFSRLLANRHWPIDVICAVVLCLVLGFFVVNRKEDK